jgi:hypothetical protein
LKRLDWLALALALLAGAALAQSGPGSGAGVGGGPVEHGAAPAVLELLTAWSLRQFPQYSASHPSPADQ